MEFLLGALSTAAFLLCLYGAYKLGQRSRKPAHKSVDEETREKAKRLHEGFQQLMNYDVTTALKGKG